MTKDNVLFSIIGLLLGCIVGFLFANSYNQSHMNRPAASSSQAPGSLPPNHPPVSTNGVSDAGAGGATGASGAGMPAVQQAIEEARNQPNNFDAQVKAADLYLLIHRYDDALQFLMKANQIRPEDYEVVVKLGDANFDADHFEVAEKWYTA